MTSIDQFIFAHVELFAAAVLAVVFIFVFLLAMREFKKPEEEETS